MEPNRLADQDLGPRFRADREDRRGQEPSKDETKTVATRVSASCLTFAAGTVFGTRFVRESPTSATRTPLMFARSTTPRPAVAETCISAPASRTAMPSMRRPTGVASGATFIRYCSV